MYFLTIEKKIKLQKVGEEEVKKNSYGCKYDSSHNNNKIQI